MPFYNIIQKKINHLLSGGNTNILAALAFEASLLSLLAFVFLFTLEIILPGLISSRFVLAKFLFGISILIFLSAMLGKKSGLIFPASVKIHTLPKVIIALWMIGILTISLIRFPIWSIPLFVLAFLGIGYLFKKILLDGEGR